jgi:hypothetical protein
MGVEVLYRAGIALTFLSESGFGFGRTSADDPFKAIPALIVIQRCVLYMTLFPTDCRRSPFHSPEIDWKDYL